MLIKRSHGYFACLKALTVVVFFFSILRIRRVRIYCDMIEAFQAKDIMTSELKIVMVAIKGNDERGVDVGGVYRDAISCFWQEFYDS